MEEFSIEELRSIVASQMEAAICSVCMEVLQPTLVVCVQGHGVCRACYKQLKCCPICKGAFSHNKPILLTQLLETLPHECKHKGCSYFVRGDDDHEKWCGHIHTECKKCNWVGNGSEILSHVKKSHPKLYIFKEKNNCQLVNFDPQVEIVCDYAPFFAHEQFFWGECSMNLKNQSLEMKYHIVRNGKVKKTTYVVLQMRNSKIHITYKLKLCLGQKIEPSENRISIGTSTLNSFIDKNNNLCYQVDFVQTDQEE